MRAMTSARVLLTGFKAKKKSINRKKRTIRRLARRPARRLTSQPFNSKRRVPRRTRISLLVRRPITTLRPPQADSDSKSITRWIVIKMKNKRKKNRINFDK